MLRRVFLTACVFGGIWLMMRWLAPAPAPIPPPPEPAFSEFCAQHPEHAAACSRIQAETEAGLRDKPADLNDNSNAN